ncbi:MULTISPECIES: hypothetical protein [unclassified Mesorhizobium]|uniref:hypothetical protein n=1 Tax=unclassified Mesorhizobium TaxID=325217 RepID=UPI003337FB01
MDASNCLGKAAQSLVGGHANPLGLGRRPRLNGAGKRPIGRAKDAVAFDLAHDPFRKSIPIFGVMREAGEHHVAGVVEMEVEVDVGRQRKASRLSLPTA